MSRTAPRALIAEDEPILAQVLARMLGRLWPELELAAVVDNGLAAAEHALASRPDVMFLDIRMPGKTGLEVAQELAEEWPQELPFPLIVFVTAHDEYALRAFEHAAIDYLLKPVDEERLARTVRRLQQRLAQGHGGAGELERIIAQLHAVMPAPAASTVLKVIRAGAGNQIRMLPVERVLYFEAADKYVIVATAEGDALIRTSLRELLPQLDADRFWQIHRSIVVNLDHVDGAVRDDAGRMVLQVRNCQRRLPVSRVFAHRFRPM